MLSWVVFSVKVCPSAVVTSSESGTGPTTDGPEVLVVQEALAPGLNIIPTPSRSSAGLNSTSTATMMASFFTIRHRSRLPLTPPPPESR